MIALDSKDTLSSNIFSVAACQARHHGSAWKATRLSASPKAHIGCLALLSQTEAFFFFFKLLCQKKSIKLKTKKKALNCVVSIKMSIKRGFSETC